MSAIERVLSVLADGGTRALVVTGGEPLLRSDIADVLSAMRKQGFQTALQTNAVLLHKNMDVLDLVDWLCLPLDGSTREVCERVRGSQAVLQPVLGALAHLKTNRHADLKVKIGTVVTTDNVGDLISIARLLLDYPVDVWKCHEIRARGIAPTDYQRLHVPGPAIRSVLQTVKAAVPSVPLHFSEQSASVGAYLLVFPDGEMFTTLLEGYRHLGSIFSVSAEFDYRTHLDCQKYFANVRAAFLDSFLRETAGRVRLRILPPFDVVREALHQVVGLLVRDDRGAPIEIAGREKSVEHALQAIVLPACNNTSSRGSTDLRDALAQYPDVPVWAYGVPHNRWEQIANSPDALLCYLNRQVIRVGEHLTIADMLSRVASMPDNGSSIVQSLYPSIPAILLRSQSSVLLQYAILHDLIDRSCFDLSAHQWSQIRAGIEAAIRAAGCDQTDYFASRLNTRLMHDLKVSARSVINYVACMFAFDDCQSAAPDAVSALGTRLGVTIPATPFLEAVEYVKSEVRQSEVKGYEGPRLYQCMSGLRLLLIDDRPEQWPAVLEAALGCIVDTVNSARPILEDPSAVCTYDLIALDLHLSDADRPDGLDVLAKLASLPSRPPVIVFTSSEHYRWRAEADRSLRGVGFANKNMESLAEWRKYVDFRDALVTAVATKCTITYLQTPRIQEHVVQMADAWSSYSNGVVTREAILHYLRQFGSPRNIDAAMALLSGVRFFSRQRTASVMKELLASPEIDCARSIVVDCGGLYDSSKQLSYVLGDLLQQPPYSSLSTASSLHEALALVRGRRERLDTIIFCDDLIGMGRQMIQIYCEWLDVEPPQTVDSRRHVTPLAAADRELFRSLRLRHHWVVGFVDGMATLGAFLSMHGFSSVAMDAGIVTREKDSCFGGAAGVFASEEEAAWAKTVFTQLGVSLSGGQVGRALGYGNSAKLLVFFYNVPTCTVTALWKQGSYGGRPFVPLFPRREKQ